MKQNKIFSYVLAAMIAGALFSSCRKERDEQPDSDTSAAADNALAEKTFSDVHAITDEAASGSLASFLAPGNADNSRSMLSTCATITNDTVAAPHLLTIDFGSSNCLCADGRYRRGIINVSYTGHYRDSASTHTITFNNYFVNDNQVLGSKTVTNNGHNSSGNLTFSITVNGQIIKPGTGGTITWTSNRTREWIQGESTATRNDDVYLVTGTASGTTAAGNSFTATINSALKIDLSCHHIVSGVLTVAPSGKYPRVIDFGAGACDDQATVTINGHTYTITLH